MLTVCAHVHMLCKEMCGCLYNGVHVTKHDKALQKKGHDCGSKLFEKSTQCKGMAQGGDGVPGVILTKRL